MPPACDAVKDAGNCLLMATHQLKQQPFSNKVRYNLVDSARNILEGTMKVSIFLSSVLNHFRQSKWLILLNMEKISTSFHKILAIRWTTRIYNWKYLCIGQPFTCLVIFYHHNWSEYFVSSKTVSHISQDDFDELYSDYYIL